MATSVSIKVDFHIYMEVKVVMLGAMNCGKASLAQRYVQDTFDLSSPLRHHTPYLSKAAQIDNWRIDLDIWPTKGQERYRSLLPLYLRGAASCMLVYDVNSRESFEELGTWKQLLEDSVRLSKGLLPFVVVGSKVDLEQEVGWSEAETWARSSGAPLFLCSAKTGQGVEAAFLEAARLGLNRQSR